MGIKNDYCVHFEHRHDAYDTVKNATGKLFEYGFAMGSHSSKNILIDYKAIFY